MNLTTISEPAAEPIAVSYLYSELRLDTEGSPPTHPDDARLASLIATGRHLVEKACRRTLVEKVLRLSMPSFPSTADAYSSASGVARMGLVREIRLYEPPVVRVESVTYFDSSNVEQTVSASDYYLTDEQVPALRFVSAFSPPAVYDRPDAVRVTYTAGYSPAASPATSQEEWAANVPAALKQAVAVAVRSLYDAMAPQEAEMNDREFERLVQPFRVQLAI